MPEHRRFKQGPRDLCKAPEGKVEIPSPGPAPTRPNTSIVTLIVPLIVTTIGMSVLFVVSSMRSGGQIILMTMAISIPLMIGTYIVSLFNYVSQRRKYSAEVDSRTARYRSLLQEKRDELEELRHKTKACLLKNDPAFSECLTLASNLDARRFWSRIPNDQDFLRLRLGLGTLPFGISVVPPRPQNLLDPDALENEAQQLAEDYWAISDVPIQLNLNQATIAGIAGDRTSSVETARLLILQIATHHSPDNVKIVAVYPESEANQWAWMRWIPHVWSVDRQQRYLASNFRDARSLLEDLTETLKQRESQLSENSSQKQSPDWPIRFVFFFAEQAFVNDGVLRLIGSKGSELGTSAIFFADRAAGLPRNCVAIVNSGSDATLTVRLEDSDVYHYIPDRISIDAAEQFSRSLAPVQMESAKGSIPNMLGLFELFGKRQVEDWDVLSQWGSADPYESLAVSVGLGAGARPIVFDIHDDQHGPHGLVAGTTRSGKTRFLESYVATLAAMFHPRDLAFIFIDFKGSDFLQNVSNLPHCIGVLSNIEGKTPEEQRWLSERVLKALVAESKRRQKAFEIANVNKISAYQKNRKLGEDLDSIPRLIIVVDEFAELANKLPDFLVQLVHTARIGGSLGMHLILATQQPAGIVTEQIWANSRFQISFKFNRTQDSQAVLERPEAAYIEQSGRGYLRIGQNELFEMFQAPYGQLPYAEDVPLGSTKAQEVEVLRVALDGSKLRLNQPGVRVTQTIMPTEISALVDYINHESEKAGIVSYPPAWPDEIPEYLSLDFVDIAHSWTGSGWNQINRWLHPVIGLLDDATIRDPRPLQPNLGRNGHIYICSESSQGNRLPLRTLVTSLALDHSPNDLHIYGLDLGAYSLRIFDDLPHCGAIIRPNEPRRITRLFRWMQTELESRQEWLVQRGFSSLLQMRARDESASIPAVLLIIDNLAYFRDNPDRVDELTRLAAEGAAVGIHLVIAGDTRTQLMSRLLNVIPQPRLALGFGDWRDFHEVIETLPRDMVIKTGIQDRGVYYDTDVDIAECQIAAPAAGNNESQIEKALDQLVKEMSRVADTVDFRKPFSIGDLPVELPIEEIMPEDISVAWQENHGSADLTVPIAMDDLTLSPLEVNLRNDGPHFMIVGPQNGGRTAALQTWLLSLAAYKNPTDVQFILFDSPRRRLELLNALPHVWRHAANEDEVSQTLLDFKKELERRGNISNTPAFVIAIDDYGYFGPENVRSELAEIAQQGVTQNIHILISGLTGDFARWNPLEKAVLKYKSGLLIGSSDFAEDAELFGITMPLAERSEKMIRGRGYFLHQRGFRLIQSAVPSGNADINKWVKRIENAATLEG